jgi:hypothetical protein
VIKTGPLSIPKRARPRSPYPVPTVPRGRGQHLCNQLRQLGGSAKRFQRYNLCGDGASELRQSRIGLISPSARSPTRVIATAIKNGAALDPQESTAPFLVSPTPECHEGRRRYFTIHHALQGPKTGRNNRFLLAVAVMQQNAPKWQGGLVVLECYPLESIGDRQANQYEQGSHARLAFVHSGFERDHAYPP